MAFYRAYLLARDGSIIGFHVIDAADDETALRIARNSNALCAELEVWQRSRLVGRVEPDRAMEGVELTDAHAVLLAALAAKCQADMMIHDRAQAADRIAKFKRVMAERALSRFAG